MDIQADLPDFAMQARWETEGVRRATRLYHEAAASKEPHELPLGRKLLRDVVPPLTEAIRKAQEEAVDLLGQPGRAPLWCWPAQLLDAEQLAVITICVALRTTMDDNGGCTSGAAVGRTAQQFCRAVRDQAEYERWTLEQKAANKAAKAAPDEPHRDLLKAFRLRYPQADRRVWAKWRRKLELARSEPLGVATELAFGAFLIKLLADSSDGRFITGIRHISRGRTEAYLDLSPETQELLQDLTARAEVAQPLRMPMLIPPIKWKYEERAA